LLTIPPVEPITQSTDITILTSSIFILLCAAVLHISYHNGISVVKRLSVRILAHRE
jgi:hypothetical protein